MWLLVSSGRLDPLDRACLIDSAETSGTSVEGNVTVGTGQRKPQRAAATVASDHAIATVAKRSAPAPPCLTTQASPKEWRGYGHVRDAIVRGYARSALRRVECAWVARRRLGPATDHLPTYGRRVGRLTTEVSEHSRFGGRYGVPRVRDLLGVESA